jgi:hypothetical protein
MYNLLVVLTHRYLITRLSLQVVYLWRHVSSTAPPFILWWWNLETLLGPLHRSSPFKESWAVKLFKWNTVLYSRENPKRSLYCKMSVYWLHTVFATTMTILYRDRIYQPALYVVPILACKPDKNCRWQAQLIGWYSGWGRGRGSA